MGFMNDESYLGTLTSAPTGLRSSRDEALLEYLAAYEEYTTCHIELEAQLKQGHMALSRARRDLTSRSGAGSPLGATLFPREFSALLTLAEDDTDEQEQDKASRGGRDEAKQARHLRVVMQDADGPECRATDESLERARDDNAAPPAPAAPASVAEVESATRAELARWGMGDSALQREIAAAVTDNGDDVGMACGDVIAIEHRDGAAGAARTLSHSAYTARSAMSFSPSVGMGDLKRAQFAAMIASEGNNDGSSQGANDAAGGPRPKPQQKPSGSRDPLKWFTLLPPPSLRQAQKGFRSATESIAACANAQARMESARSRLEELMPPKPSPKMDEPSGESPPAETGSTAEVHAKR